MKLTLQQKILAGVLVVIAIAVFGWCQRREGVKTGALNQEIVTSTAAVKDLKLEAVVVDKAAQVEVKKSVAKRADYQAARAKVELKGDTVIADGQSIVLPSVAAALVKADTMSVEDSTAIAKQARSDTLKTVLVGALDHHVDLLEEAKRPRCSVKCGVVIGTVTTVAVVIIAVKIIRAVGHK